MGQLSLSPGRGLRSRGDKLYRSHRIVDMPGTVAARKLRYRKYIINEIEKDEAITKTQLGNSFSIET